MINRNSLEAYKNLYELGALNDQEFIVLKNLTLVRGATSRDLSVLTGLERSSVTGRLNSLVKKGYVSNNEDIICHTTNRTVTYYKLIKKEI